jgi:hypothetical protein
LINLGLPKSGTTTLQNYLNCPYRTPRIEQSYHWAFSYHPEVVIADCVIEAIRRNTTLHSIEGGCNTHWDAITEVSACCRQGVSILPQVTHLSWLLAIYLDAQFVYTWRPPESWATSAIHYNIATDLVTFLRQMNNSDYTMVGDSEFAILTNFFIQHYHHVLKLFENHPKDLLVVDIESPITGDVLDEVLGLDDERNSVPCFGHHNVGNYRKADEKPFEFTNGRLVQLYGDANIYIIVKTTKKRIPDEKILIRKYGDAYARHVHVIADDYETHIFNLLPTGIEATDMDLTHL